MSNLVDLEFPTGSFCNIFMLRSFFETSCFHTHREWEFNLITSGHGTYLLRDKECQLEPGTLIWFDPDQEHLLVDASHDFCIWVVVFKVGIEDLFQDALKERRQIYDQKGIVPRLNNKDMRFLENLLVSFVENPKEVSQVGANFLMELSLSQSLKPNMERSLTAKNDMSFVVIKKLRKDPTIPLGVIAEELGVSPATLSRVFQKEMGISPSIYRNKIRLYRFLEIKKKGSHKSLLSLALESGFGSYAQFHRVFCENFGKSPKELKALDMEECSYI